jgi:hypothetical protein
MNIKFQVSKCWVENEHSVSQRNKYHLQSGSLKAFRFCVC